MQSQGGEIHRRPRRARRCWSPRMLFGGGDGSMPRADHGVTQLHEMTRPCRGRRDADDLKKDAARGRWGL
eukprot:30204-Heterocapsa_arctica.AAC.2